MYIKRKESHFIREYNRLVATGKEGFTIKSLAQLLGINYQQCMYQYKKLVAKDAIAELVEIEAYKPRVNKTVKKEDGKMQVTVWAKELFDLSKEIGGNTVKKLREIVKDMLHF